MNCPECSGTGMCEIAGELCCVCAGYGTVSAELAATIIAAKTKPVPCPACDGSGNIACDSCAGTGDSRTRFLESGECRDCEECDGAGAEPCPWCEGDGTVTPERAAEYHAAIQKGLAK